MNTVLGIVILVMSIFLVATILLQSSKDHRMSGTIAGGAETFFGKQKGKTMDGLLNKLTTIVCIIFFIVVLVMYVLQPEATPITPSELDNVITEEDIANLETEVEGEAETETEAEAETEVEAETETEAETEAEVEGETEAEAEVETETEETTAE